MAVTFGLKCDHCGAAVVTDIADLGWLKDTYCSACGTVTRSEPLNNEEIRSALAALARAVDAIEERLKND